MIWSTLILIAILVIGWGVYKIVEYFVDRMSDTHTR